MKIGNVNSKPGTIQYGRYETFAHPTGEREDLPLIIAEGSSEGPCIWLTAAIHGDEHAGPLVIYRLLEDILERGLRGTIVALPVLNPAGLRQKTRKSFYDDTDPNRLWPEKWESTADQSAVNNTDAGSPAGAADSRKKDTSRPLSPLERVYAKLYDDIAAFADYLIDFHCFNVGALSFAFRDRVLYAPGEKRDSEAHDIPMTGMGRAAGMTAADAEVLSGKIDRMLAAYGHTTICEYSSDRYLEEKLHRSVAGSVLLFAGIPTFTAELGTNIVPDPGIVAAAAAGTRNVLRWAGMLAGEMEPIKTTRVIDPGYMVRRDRTPVVEESCIVRHLLEPGDFFRKGTPLAELIDIWGRPMEPKVLYAEADGFVLCRSEGITFYPGQYLYTLAVRDDFPLTGPYPRTDRTG